YKQPVVGEGALVIDLEDGVAPGAKPKARENMRAALVAREARRSERIVRINAMTSPESSADLGALPIASVDTVFVPKVESRAEIERLDADLSRCERAHGYEGHPPIGIIATIETPRGLWRALEIADASPRVTALFFGSGDYTLATGASVTERALAGPRALVVAAAAAAGIEAIDAAYFLDVKDQSAVAADARIARELGFKGKLVFHPSQIAPVNEIMSPSADEIARARRIRAAFDSAAAEGRGTAVIDGQFIAIDIALMADRVLARAAALGLA
ncbi:MAG TPA: CoA ester lyase, partial [Hyphomicrobiaceae bacterium]|nr:CoA ester lyase [Hyphomicrobiaceae bacterium]